MRYEYILIQKLDESDETQSKFYLNFFDYINEGVNTLFLNFCLTLFQSTVYPLKSFKLASDGNLKYPIIDYIGFVKWNCERLTRRYTTIAI